MAKNITKVLIANRGEIALRIQRACHALGIKTVSVCSEADQNSMFARRADELIILGPPAPAQSYLNIERLIEAAEQSGADAVHPGYGFLSENAQFAQRVVDAGLTYIGPSPQAIAAMGSKTEARKCVTAWGVPCTPGSVAGLSDKELAAEAERIGWPVIVKAVAGGGGRGMRIANNAGELKEFLPRARAEALKNFANQDVYIEKYIVQPRHVEVQIMGDMHGNIVHLGTRDCSTQRRHQKLIEEAPAPNIPAELRERMHQAAVNAAKSVNYHNAGTVEMLLEGENFYFLEMNTRIQVEHPVTEVVTGVDLVQLQLRVAQGERLPFSQEQIAFKGHAIEYRIYAEDPCNGFMPSIGKISRLSRPEFDFVREDSGYEQGDSITTFYDAMLSKLIVRGADREDAIEKSREIINSYALEGVSSSIDYHRWHLYNTCFPEKPVDIGFIEREFGPNQVRELKACRVKDVRHIPPVGGIEVIQRYEYKSEKYKTTYTIEVVHRKDGFFLARPVNTDGKAAQKAFARMSNGLKGALTSVQDVLENTSPKEMFIN